MPNIYDMADTWNNAATVFTAIKMNVTDTASNASSLLMDLQVGGSKRFTVDKNGDVVLGSSGVGRSLTVNTVTYGGALILRHNVGDDVRVVSNTIGTPVLGFYSAGSQLAQLFVPSANVIQQRRGANAQTFEVYNTYTNASNYERSFIRWASNFLEIGTEAAGTGTLRAIKLIGSLPTSDPVVANQLWNDGGTLKISAG